jgi:hypothetical protein
MGAGEGQSWPGSNHVNMVRMFGSHPKCDRKLLEGFKESVS